MTTYTQMQDRIWRALNDTSQTRYSEALIYDGFCGACDAILQWIPNNKRAVLTSGSMGYDLDMLLLPADVYQVDVVQIVDTGIIISKATMAPETIRSAGSNKMDWVDSPKGFLTLSEPMVDGDQVRIWYRAFWPKPANESDSSFVLEIPNYVHTGLVYYVCSYCLTPSMMNTGTLGQFKVKTDSGGPEDNPLQDLADYFMRRFLQEMKLAPQFARVGVG